MVKSFHRQTDLKYVYIFFFKEKGWERCNIGTFQEVTHLSTILAQACLIVKF